MNADSFGPPDFNGRWRGEGREFATAEEVAEDGGGVISSFLKNPPETLKAISCLTKVVSAAGRIVRIRREGQQSFYV